MFEGGMMNVREADATSSTTFYLFNGGSFLSLLILFISLSMAVSTFLDIGVAGLL